MDAISSLFPSSSVAATQSAGNKSDSTATQAVEGSGQGQAAGTADDFSTFLTQILGRSGQDQVNEEELYSGLIGEKLQEKSTEAYDYYQQQFTQIATARAHPDGYVPVEDVAKAALKATVDAGKVDDNAAEMINGEAFQAAQLDDNTSCLYDGLGMTKAVGSFDSAVQKIRATMDQITSGAIKVDPRSLGIPSNQGTTPGTLLLSLAPGANSALAEQSTAGAGATATDAAAGTDLTINPEKQVRFTWKEVASDGNLAILLPTSSNGKASGVSLYGPDGELLEKGNYTKQTHDFRAVYRFDKPGSEYGNDITVVVDNNDGTKTIYKVGDGGKRTYVPEGDGKVLSNSEAESYINALNGPSSSSSSSQASKGTGSSGSSSGGSSSSSSSASTATGSTQSSSGFLGGTTVSASSGSDAPVLVPVSDGGAVMPAASVGSSGSDGGTTPTIGAL